MRESLYNRLMVWCADSSPRVQYPVPRRNMAPPFRLVWNYPMPFGQRVFLFFVGLLCVLFGTAFLAFLAVVVWGAIFNTAGGA